MFWTTDPKQTNKNIYAKFLPKLSPITEKQIYSSQFLLNKFQIQSVIKKQRNSSLSFVFRARLN